MAEFHDIRQYRPHKGAKADISADFVRSVLDYNPETGRFTWKRRADRTKTWNARYGLKPTGTLRKDGNVVLRINDTLYLAHRIAWLFYTGNWPEYEIDHKNRERSDNRISNLREATSQENLRNQAHKPSNRSGYKGVSFFKRDGTWRAQIRDTSGRQRHIGYYATPHEAHAAYEEKAKEFHGKFMCCV